MKKTLLPLITLLVFCNLHVVSAQLTPHEVLPLLGRGINLGNTLEAPLEGSWNPKAEEYYFDNYVEAGFKTVRIPVTWNEHVSKTAPYKIDAAWLERVEEVVDWGLSRDLYIILNAHHEDWLKETFDQETTRVRFDSIWSQISVHFKGKSEKLFFEILNEPRTHTHEGLTQTQIDDLNVRILSIIRKDHPTRIVVYSGKGWASPYDMRAAAIPDDPYIMAYYHDYSPWYFAGEGNGTWGSASDKNILRNTFTTVKNWATQNNMVVLLGEFGAIYDCDYNSRMRFYAAYVEECLKNNIAFAVWDDGGWFRVMEREDTAWNELKDILIYTTPEAPTNIISEIIGDENVKVSWTLRTSDHDSLILERRVNGGAFVPYKKLPRVATSFTDSTLATENNYYYRVVATYNNSINLPSYPTRSLLKITKQVPFNGTPHAIPGVIEAEEYDKGGEGLAYHESTPDNIPSDYRANEGVDIEARTEGGYQLSYVAANEWVEYTINVAEAGAYEITVPVAAQDGGGIFILQFQGNNSKVIKTVSTSSWQTTVDMSTTVQLLAGEQVMKMSILKLPQFNLDKFIFSNVTALDKTNINGMNVYPIPANDRLFISNLDASIKDVVLDVFSVGGQHVICTNNYNIDNGINIQKLSPGSYLLRIQIDGKILYSKFIKQ